MNPVSTAHPGRATLAWRCLPWLLVALQLAWWSQGVWPITPVEGDEQGVIFGVEGMVQHDETRLQLRYKYDVQPGSYHLLAALTRLTGASVETIFGVTTIIGALGFALAGAWLLQLLLKLPLGWTLATMLWAQEVTTAACYSNTSALAGGIAILGVLLATHATPSGWLWSGTALAVGGWLRADCLLVAPACLGLAYWQLRVWRPAIIRTALIALVATAGVAILYWASGTSLGNAFGVYDTQMGAGLTGRRLWVEMPVQLLSPALVLAALGGAGLMLKRREIALSLVVLSGSIATLTVYGSVITTPKYLFYLIPFALVPALLVAGLLRQLPVWPARLAMVGVLLCDGLLGLRTLEPAQRFFTTSPTWATFCRTGNGNLALVVGPGELIFNADAFRLRTGHQFAPLCWQREKERMRADLATIRSWLETGRDQTIFWSGWLPLQVAQRELLAAGFHPPDGRLAEPKAAPRETWRRQGQVVQLGFLGYVGSEFQAPGPAPASTTGLDTHAIGGNDWGVLAELADDRRWSSISFMSQGLIVLYQRR
jgi:hypothetical protein